MKISLNWLRDFVDCRLSAPEIEAVLRRAGLSVEGIESRGAAIDNVIVARILESNPHPNADRLSVCRVDDGTGAPRQIVCGAKNYKVGDNVPLALPGAVLPGDFKIKTGKLRGVESEGMMCSAGELRLADDAEGLLILSPDAIPGTPLEKLYPADVLLELEITPNRPDWLSHLGVAREIGIFTALPVGPPVVSSPPSAPAGDEVRLESEACPYYTLRKIRGVKVGPSPQWLRDRLASVGLRPINNVVDVTNYVLLELGQPLHAFDAAKISGGLRVRRAADGESFRALDGRDYRLGTDALVIADEARPVALAGVMGGGDSGVTGETTDILLESAVFDPAWVRRASRSFGLSSDSSYRFERGVDPEMVAFASARAADLILRVAGGEADAVLLETGARWTRADVALRHARARSLLGVALSDAEIEESLAKTGLEKTAGSATDSSWAVPGFRREIAREADLIEEISRMIGIGRIPASTAALFAPSSPADRVYDFAMSLRLRLAGFGFHEARTGTLVRADDARESGIKLRNPLGDDQSHLRTSLLPGLLAALKLNLDQGAASIRLFEYGRVFSTKQPEESQRIAIAATGQLAAATWREATPRAWDIFDLKGIVRELANLGEEDFSPMPDPPDIFGAALDVFKNGQRIGIVGQLRPARARQLGTTHPVLLAEFDTRTWQDLCPSIKSAAPLPKFPASTRDIALTAPLALPFGSVRAAIAAQNEPLLESATLFDLFTDPGGKNLPADKKSVAISLTFRAPERTLTTEEVNAATGRLKSGLKERLGVGFRD